MKKKYTRMTAFTVIVLCIFSILLLRLAYIQIVNGETFKNTAEAKGEKKIIELASRGEILDVNHKKIATDQQSFNVTYTNGNVKLDNETFNKELLECINIIVKNGDSDKLNNENFQIAYDAKSKSYNFTFPTKKESLKVTLANNIVKNYKLGLPLLNYVEDSKKTEAQNLAINESNLSKRAKDIFCIFAEKFGLTKASLANADKKEKSKTKKNNSTDSVIIDYNLRSDISIDNMQKLIAFRLAIIDTSYSQYRAVYIANNVKRETFLALCTKADDLIGINTEISPMRVYPNGQLGSAFLGYLGKIDESEAQKYTNLDYDISRELVGKMGLEKVLENDTEDNIRLRGEPGFKFVNVDKFGKVLKNVATLDPIPGDTVVTTIRLDIQKVLEDSLDQNMADIVSGKIKSDARYTNATRSAGVVVDVNTGEVLALASRPGFDPNWFSATGSISNEISKIVFPTEDDKYDLLPKPMFNYATMGSGPPGSTFKPLVALAALEESKTTNITPTTTIIDRGVYSVVKGFKGACWKWNEQHSTHGAVNLAKALEVSCNYFFFDLGRRLGYANFEKWAYKFGLASNPQTGEAPSTGIEIGERPGEVSSPDRYKATNINFIMRDEVITYLNDYKHGGYVITKGTEEYKTIKSMFMDGAYDEDKLKSIGIANTKALLHLKNQINQFNRDANSIGQLLNASIGQGSTLLTPLQMVNYIATLVNGGNRYKLHLVKEVLDPNGAVKKEIQPELLDKINLDPANVNAVKDGMRKVTEEGGTASTAFNGFPFPTGGKTGSASVSLGQKNHGRSAYGWYVGFAPLDHPKIAVCIVVYDAGHGGSVAPVARAVYNQYFGLNKPNTSQTTTNSGINTNIH